MQSKEHKKFSIFVKILKMQLFYNPNLSIDSQFFTFDKEESKHIIKVLRKDINTILMVTNGKGILFTTQIIEATEKNCKVKIIDFKEFEKPKQNLHIAIAPTKLNDRIEWFLEKATEIGISEITFIQCNRSERNNINMDRFEKIVIAAAKQSLQYYFPKINSLIKLETFVKNHQSDHKYIAHCQELDKNEFKNVIKTDNTTLLIGPEGDFTTTEIELALANKYKAVSLGNTRLRTETAGIMACAVFEICE